jgi:hypothetical protein
MTPGTLGKEKENRHSAEDRGKVPAEKEIK